MKILKTTAILLGAVGLLHLGAKAAANLIQKNPDPYPFEQLRQEPPGETVFIRRADGTQIRAKVQGTGPTVVLAHGFAISLLEWNILWVSLQQAGYRVIAFDQRGHGQSTIGTDGLSSATMAGDYKAVLEHFDVREGILVGHSMGSFLSVVFLLTHPDVAAARLKGVVLVAGMAGNVLVGAPQNQVQIPLIKAGVIQWVARSATYKWFFGASVYGQNPSPAGIRVFCEVFDEQAHQQLIPILDGMAQEDYYDRLGEINVPCVVVCGRADKTTPPWHSIELGQRIPQAHNVWVEGKGHLLNWEAPDVLFDAIQSLQRKS
ncbi:MAG: alpha/beta hydrolase [Chloroflexi bacterium]|nr:alpha/beta hydrolase [Chloroflexota bacterium]